MKRRKLNVNRVCYAISISVTILMLTLYIAACAIMKESEYNTPQIERVNIAFYMMNGVELEPELQKSLENGNINIRDLYIVFSKDRNGVTSFVGIEGSDEIKITETRKNRDGSVTRVIGLK